MKYKVFLTKKAEQELNEIIDYMVTNGDVNSAYKTFKKIRDRVELLKISHEQGRAIPELEMFKVKDYREVIVKPWRIIYKIEKEIIKVLLVIDGRRNVEDILFDKLLVQ